MAIRRSLCRCSTSSCSESFPWPGTKLCHSAQVPSFKRSQTVEPNTKETFIQRRYSGYRRSGNDWRH
jgi:hypothetical protein